MDEQFSRVRTSFGRQGLMTLLGASLSEVGHGSVEITCPIDERLTQQHGAVHAGVLVSLGDNACGYAVLSSRSDTEEVLTVELKANFLEPARGDLLRAEGRVVRAGQRLAVCQGDVFAETAGTTLHVATMLATISIRRQGLNE